MVEFGRAIEWGTWRVYWEDLGWFDRVLIRLRVKPFPTPIVIPKPDNILEILSRDAAKHLPPGTRYEIREKIPVDFGCRKGMAWYSTPSMKEDVEWADPTESEARPGYRLLHRCMTGETEGTPST